MNSYVPRGPVYAALMAPSERLDRMTPAEHSRYVRRVTRGVFRQNTRGVLGEGRGDESLHFHPPALKQQPQQGT